jgi:hypothetical protein
MRGQTSHLDPDVLAEFRAGLITGRRRRVIAAHLAGCERCAAVGEQLAELSTLLAAIPVPTMPDTVAQRLDAVLAAEVARKDEAERAGADRSRDRKRAPRPARRPSLRLVTVRVLAPAAAVVALAAGGYGLSSLLGAHSTSSTTAGSAAAPAPRAVPSAAQANGTSPILGMEKKAAFSILPSRTDYLRTSLRSQLQAALRALAAERAVPAPSAQPASARPPAPLQACVQRLTSGISPGTVELVQSAHFQGQPAIVIVVSSGDGYLAWVVAPGWVAPGCSASSAGVLAGTTLPGI